MSNTPILDRVQPLPPKKSRDWRLLLVGGVIGGLLVFLDTRGVFPSEDSMLIGFLPAFYVGVLLHELGHVVAGLTANFELRGLAVGAFSLHKESQGWKFRFLLRRIVGGGLTVMMPHSADRLIDRYIRLVLGGPAASLALFVVTLVWTLVDPESNAARVLLLVNLVLILSVCLPYTVRSQPTDAKLVLLLNRKGPAAERLAAVLYIFALEGQRVAPRDWPRDLVEKISIQTKDNSFLASAAAVWYADALDSGDVQRIAAALERALSVSNEFGSDMQRAFYVAASCFHSSFCHHLPLAETWLDMARKVKNTASQPDWDSKALALISLERGANASAQDLLARYLKVLDRYPASGAIDAERARTVDLINGGAVSRTSGDAGFGT